MDSERRPLLGSSPRVEPPEGEIPSYALGFSGQESSYRVYPGRWYILGVLAWLNFCSGLLWVSFSPIADSTAEFYNISATKVNLLAVTFMVVSVPFGLLSAWLLDVGGLRIAIILSAWLNVAGSCVRVLSAQTSILPAPWRYPVLLGGQTIAALGQPLVMFAPTKIAGLWFAADQRALANTIASVSNPLGIMIGNVLSPVIVKGPQQIPLLLYIYTAPAVLATLLATFGVCRSVPPTPPSASAEEVSEPFSSGLKKLLRSPQYWLLATSFGTAVALFTVVNTLIEQILCPLGYSDKFAGWCAALMIAVGLIGATIAALYVDKTKKFEEVAKGGICLATIALIGFFVVARYPDMHTALIILVSLTGFFGFASNPIYLELSVECTYPIAEATSAGLMLISSQIQSLVCVLVMQVMARPFDPSAIQQSTCHVTGASGMEPVDYTVPNLCLCTFGSVVCVIFTLGFKCDYKRMTAEKTSAAEQILGQSQQPGVVSINSAEPIRASRLPQGAEPQEHWAESIGPGISGSGQWAGSSSATPPIRRGHNQLRDYS